MFVEQLELVHVPHRRIELSVDLPQEIEAAVMSRLEIRFQFQRLLMPGDRLGRLLLFQAAGQEVGRVRVTGILLHGALEMHPRLGNPSGMKQRQAQAISRHGVIRIGGDNLLENRNRRGSLLGEVEHRHGQVDPGIQPGGMVIDQLLEDLHRLLVLVLLHQPGTAVVLGNQLGGHTKRFPGLPTVPGGRPGPAVAWSRRIVGTADQQYQQQQWPKTAATRPADVGH